MKQRQKRGKPAFVVRQGSASVTGYKYGKTNRFCLVWYRFKGDKPQRQTKTGERAARDRAREVAIALANGRADVLEITGAKRESFLYIEQRAKEIGVPIVDLVEQAVASKLRLGDSSLAEAVDGYLQTHSRRGRNRTVPEVFAQFMRTKETELANGDLSDVHVRKTRQDLQKFVADHPGPIASYYSDQLQDWINKRAGKNGKAIGGRRRRHIRDRIVSLFNAARDAGDLPLNVRHAAEKTKRPKVVKGIEPTFDADQFSKLIHGAHADEKWIELVPCLAIGAWGRMRPSEIARLDWRAIHLFDERPGTYLPIAGEIDVSPQVAGKTGEARIIEVPPTLAAWLRLYWRSSGPVLNPKIHRLDHKLRALANKMKVTIKRNILRGSSASYLFALTNDLEYVSAQHGNSVRVMRREYIERKTREQAEAWYAVIPPARGNIIPIGAAAS